MAKGCPSCGKVFTSSYKNFKTHIRMQHKPILCEICGVCCLDKKLLDEHLALKHVKKFVCQHCGKKVYDDVIDRHIKKCHAYCAKCDKLMVNPQEKCQHMLEKISERNKCRYCEEVFESQKKKYEHIRQVHQVHLNLCFECGKSFVSEEKLARHERILHSEARLNKPKKTKKPKHNLFKCEICDKTFPISSKLRRHIEIGI